MLENGVFRLPVAGVDVVMRAPAGVDELVVVEGASDFGTASRLCDELIRRADGGAFVWNDAVITDLDAAILSLRRAVLGDTLRADVRCGQAECGERVDIAFSIASYLEHHRPQPTSTARAEELGWFRVDGTEFRLPRVSDQIAIALSEAPEQALLQRCTRAAFPLDDVSRQRVEAAIETMAPSLSGELEGRCPGCGRAILVTFDPLVFCLEELRDYASRIYEDICTIAHHCHWSETEILALPAARRARYAELARAAR